MTTPPNFLDGDTDLDSSHLQALDRGGAVIPYSAGGLKVDVTALQYRDQTTVGGLAYAGDTNQTVTGSTTNYIYLDSTVTLRINTTGFPTKETHIPLATVVCSSSAITSINDKRPAMHLQAGPILLADPATGNALDTSKLMSAMCSLTIGASAETGTVSAPLRMGQRVLIGPATVGAGTRQFTFPAKFDGTNTKITFSAVGQLAEFVAGADLNWALSANLKTTNATAAALAV